MNTPQDSSHRPSSHGPARGPIAQAQDPMGGTQAPGARDRAEELADQARAEGQEQAQHYRNKAADTVDTFADSIKAAAAQMQDDDVAHLSGHIRDMADGLGRMADGLREKSADEILHDVRRIARENPTLFIAGSIAVGFGITRFARASAGAVDDRQRQASGRATRERPGGSRWSDPDASVPGTVAQPATGNATVDTTTPGSLTGAIPAAPGPSATGADAISARAGAAASDATASGGRDASSSDIQRGSHRP